MLIEIAGLAVSAIGTASELFTAIRDLNEWDEADIEVDGEWLGLAIKAGIIGGQESDYVWAAERRVPTLELKRSHDVVIAINKNKRLKYRVVRGQPGDAGGRSILMRRVAGG